MSSVFRVPDGPAAEPVIPFPRSDTDVARVSSHELKRLIENSARWEYLAKHCDYAEENGYTWGRDDEDRQNISLEDYVDLRMAGEIVPDKIADEDGGYCPQCNGSGEGMHDGSRCGYCRGSGEVGL